MGNGCWLRFATAISHMPARKQPCGWPGNVCQNVQINLASTPDVGEVALRLSFNPWAGARWSGWTLMRRQFLLRRAPTRRSGSWPPTSHAQENFSPLSLTSSIAFNAFYAFPEQQAALGALRLAGKPDAILCLFDYLDRGGFTETCFAEKPETLLWRPLSMNSLQSRLDQTGWSLGECLDISGDFETWYTKFVNRFAMRRQQLLKLFASELVNYAEDYYYSLLEAIKTGALGGAIVYAQAKSRDA
jgi:hypothetical protein